MRSLKKRTIANPVQSRALALSPQTSTQPLAAGGSLTPQPTLSLNAPSSPGLTSAYNADGSSPAAGSDYTPPDFTMDQQDVDTGQLGYSNANAPAGGYVSDNALVQGRLTGLLDSNSDYIKQAEAKAMETANARGLLNSSMAAGAGRSAAIEAALPIATQDAGVYAQHDLATQQGDITGALAQQQAGVEGALNTQTAGYHAELARQKGLLSGASNEQMAEIQTAEQNLVATLQMASNQAQWNHETNMQVYSAAQEMAVLEAEQALQAIIHENTVTVTQQQYLSSAYASLAENYEISVQNILLDTNIVDAETRTAALQTIRDVFEQDMTSIAEVFGATYTPAEEP